MSSTIGNIFKVSVFGESHGSHIGVTISNVPAGIKLDLNKIDELLIRRRGIKELSTSRREKDEYQIISGYFNEYTTGTPLTFLIPNLDVDDKVYDDKKNLLRPGHADFTAELKYRGFQDYRGGGHFSGRLTTCLVIAGSVAMQLLEAKGIKIASRIKQIYEVEDDEVLETNIDSLIDFLNKQEFPTISKTKKEEMKKEIIKAREEKDSLGGVVETFVNINNHILGDPIFDSVESKLSSYLFSVPALKGVSFGKGFDFAKLKGSQANDEYIVKENKITSLTNNNGGINGGITNTLPIVFESVIKATPSISKEQRSVNKETLEEVKLEIKGRHDPCITPRALYVINAVTAIALVDLVMEEYGKRYFMEEE